MCRGERSRCSIILKARWIKKAPQPDYLNCGAKVQKNQKNFHYKITKATRLGGGFRVAQGVALYYSAGSALFRLSNVLTNSAKPGQMESKIEATASLSPF